MTPGLFERALVISALPSFLVALAVVRGLARLGISELQSFMFTMAYPGPCMVLFGRLAS